MAHQPGTFASALLSLVMLGAMALVWGGWRMIARRGDKQKGVLMIVCALVLVGNVAIWAF